MFDRSVTNSGADRRRFWLWTDLLLTLVDEES
jgi:hypothetical protein